MKVSKVVMGEVKEVEVGVVNTHLATWYSDTEARWSQVRVGRTGPDFSGKNLDDFKEQYFR